MPDDLTRMPTSCYVHRLREAKTKLGMDEHATLDDLLKRVTHGNTDQQLSLDAWLQLGKTFINQPGVKPTKEPK